MNKKLKILHLTTSYPRFTGDISGSFIKNLVDALSQKSADCSVLTSAGDSPELFSYNNTRCFRYAPWKWQCLAHKPGGIPACLRNNPLTACLLPSFLANMYASIIKNSMKYDIIHAHWSICGAIACLSKRIHRKKVITTLRGSDQFFSQKKFYRQFHNIAILQSDAVVCVSKSILKELIAAYPKRKDVFYFIPNGISDEFYHINPIKRPKPPPFKFLYTGSLLPLKRIDTIITAFSLIKDTDFTFNIVGDGDIKPQLIELCKKFNLEEKVSFLGTLSNNEMPKILQDNHCLILASEREGRSNSVLEAMAGAMPVIASNIEGNSELITSGENGFLFPVGADKVLSEIISDLCGNYHKYKNIGLNAREALIKLGLTWENSAQNYINLYKKVLEI